MLDPREDLIGDRVLWELVLGCATQYRDQQIYGNLHGIRCGGAQLCIKNDTLVLKFLDNLTEEEKQNIKQKYIIPYLKQLKTLFKFVVEYMKENKTEIINQDDLFTRDIFLKGYKY